MEGGKREGVMVGGGARDGNEAGERRERRYLPETDAGARLLHLGWHWRDLPRPNTTFSRTRASLLFLGLQLTERDPFCILRLGWRNAM